MDKDLDLDRRLTIDKIVYLLKAPCQEFSASWGGELGGDVVRSEMRSVSVTRAIVATLGAGQHQVH